MSNYRHLARQKAKKYGLDPDVFERQIQAESGYNPHAVSPAGARGIAQIMPATAKGWHVNPDDPNAALDAAARNMASYVKKFGSYKNALVAYNAGPGRVGGPLPAETQNYIKTILGGKNPSTRSAKPSSSTATASPKTDYQSSDNTALALSLLGISSDYGLDPLQLALTAAFDHGMKQAPTGSLSGGKTASGYSSRPLGHVVTGSPVPGQKPHAATHETAGLPGYPAYDYMAKAGTPVVAPVSGKIVKLSGHDPKAGPTQGPHGPFGWSVYVKGDDGKTYYLTHLGSRNVKLGQRVKQGTRIGTVGNYAKYGGADHVHEGVHG